MGTSPNPALFGNIPKKDYLHLFDHGVPNGEKITRLLEYKNQDIAAATNISISSI